MMNKTTNETGNAKTRIELELFFTFELHHGQLP